MSRFEDELRKALQREEPPAGFSDRVLSRIASRPARAPWWNALLRGFERPAARWAGAVALSLVLVVAGLRYQRDREMRAEGEHAKEQVMLALRITADKLQFVQEKIQKRSYSGRENPSQ
jgi:hypothetical protein